MPLIQKRGLLTQETDRLTMESVMMTHWGLDWFIGPSSNGSLPTPLSEIETAAMVVGLAPNSQPNSSFLKPYYFHLSLSFTFGDQNPQWIDTTAHLASK
jgi:hypothetical protein